MKLITTASELVKWFFENYKDPSDGVPHDSSEGGYQYVNGGPYDAETELRSRWENIPLVSEEIIQEAIDRITESGHDWVKIDEY